MELQCMELMIGSIGSVQRVMIDKISGKVAYAVISFWRVPWYGRG